MTRLPRGKRGQCCAVHGYHRPPVTTPDEHHIWPLAEGGPDAAANRVVICPTGHRNVHEYIAAALAGRPRPRVTRAERRLATQGLAAIYEGGAP